MNNLRIYGKAPYDVVLVHGGPGAPGTMAPVARALADDYGVLEPLQTAYTLEDQVNELCTVIQEYARLPIRLIGWSWGAMLSYIFSARYPELVKNLILIGSGVYEDIYAEGILPTRLTRLTQEELIEALSLIEILNYNSTNDKNVPMARLGELFTKADSYNPLTLDTEALEVNYDIFQSVWTDAADLRTSGKLKEMGKQIRCPVLAIHGDYDPHPPEGVSKPLSEVIRNFRFILLKNCGHQPWIEVEARDKFYEILREELTVSK